MTNQQILVKIKNVSLVSTTVSVTLSNTPSGLNQLTNTSVQARKSTVSMPANGQDEMQEELKSVLTMFRDKRRILDIIKTPEIYIQQSSSAAEVEQWLVAKGFTEPVVKKLNGFNGNELFALKRHTMEDYFGSEEGRRLASQITIQRNISGVRVVAHTPTNRWIPNNVSPSTYCSTKRQGRRSCRRFWPGHERRPERIEWALSQDV